MTALQTLQKYFNYDSFRSGQTEVIEHTLSKKNSLVVMPTGSGKSLCFQVPALMQDGVTIVISPLIALMKDQVDQLVNLKIPATLINSSISQDEQAQRIRDIESGEYKIVYIAPERFYSQKFMEMISQVPISLFAIDEAHCISQWGHDFRPSYLRLNDVIKSLNNPPVIALTATATTRVQDDILDQLDLAKSKTFVSGFDRPNLKFIAVGLNEEKKKKELIRIVKSINGSGIIYVATKKAVAEISSFLSENGLPAAGYHGGMEKFQRNEAQNNWLRNSPKIIVATNAFGMGIDKPDVRFVIHYNTPGSMEAYYQEAGRAGRDGRVSYCLLFHSYRDRRIQEFLIENSFPPEQTIRDVYDFLLDLDRTEILLTYKEIAARTGTHEMQVGSAVKALEKQNILKRMTKSYVTFQADIIVSNERALSTTKRAPLQHKLINYFISKQDNVFELNETLAFLEITQEQFSGTMHNLENKSLILYQPPFRGRGIEITSKKVAWEKIGIDWPAYQKQMDLQYKKLDDIENYASSLSCRRTYILEYFGEKHSDNNCNGCDICLDWKSPEAGERGSDKTADPIKTIVHCVWEYDGKFGITTIANILKGNSEDRFSKRRIDESIYFGAIQSREIKDIIRMIYVAIKNKYIRKQGNDYPVLSVSNSGISFLRK
ncbi:MAG: ATP-dependent DNA helicase RecQ [Calditrichaeota bacterium]|nr:MAG: ATP-dependent DNA helicase RecQ [Calditrichota bacterium]MBL1205877.1 ATP-dependent DNA helicase RecQ [Calditrichota bacterium]NOG45705.1 ATP-dependent DNA helicase RecQ [Calditrichota bacterium]